MAVLRVTGALGVTAEVVEIAPSLMGLEARAEVLRLKVVEDQGAPRAAAPGVIVGDPERRPVVAAAAVAVLGPAVPVAQVTGVEAEAEAEAQACRGLTPLLLLRVAAAVEAEGLLVIPVGQVTPEVPHPIQLLTLLP